MSLLRPKDRGVRVVVAVVIGLLVAAPLSMGLGSACKVYIDICDQPDGAELPPICFDADGGGDAADGDAM